MSGSEYSIDDLVPLPNSSVQVPRLGFGVYRSPATQCTQSCLSALQAGYRHIDTAQFYTNEKEVGEAIRGSGIPRSDIFVTSKILSPAGSPSDTYDKIVESIHKIDGENGYIDLFLIHSSKSGPLGRKMLWQALEKLLEEGRLRSIGVSNFGITHIDEMKEYAKVWPPQVNQIELHPWSQQRAIVEYCRRNGIVVEAYAPIVRNYKASDPVLMELAKRYGASTQQILIRYALQKGWVPLPKSDDPGRIISNADVFRFHISSEDMEKLDSLDQGSAGAIVEAVSND